MDRRSQLSLTKTVNALLLFASILIINGTTQIVFQHIDSPEAPEIITTEQLARKISNLIPKTEIKHPEKVRKNPVIEEVSHIRDQYNDIELTYQVIETEYLGRYLITAYSDEETNSRATASGIEVHYSEDNFEPTTCAIDRRYHRFGDLFMIDGKVYIAEDTGSAVLNHHIDVFVETMEEVQNFNTRYTTVYSVEFVTHRKDGILYERFNDYLLDRSLRSRLVCGNDSRADDRG